MNGPKTVTVAWTTQYQLTTSVNNASYGSVSPSGTTWQDAGNVTVTAIANINYKFTDWGGDLSGITNPATLFMDGPKSVTANFATSQVYLTVNSDYGSPTGAGWYNFGETASSSVSPSIVSGGTGIQYICTGWTGTGSAPASGTTTNTGTFVMTEASSVTWNWTTQYYLTVASPYGSPTGAGWYNSGATASSSVSSPVNGGAGTQYVCAGWTVTVKDSSPSSGSGSSTSFSMTGPTTVNWNWTTQYYLTVTSAYGSPTGEGWYDSGATASSSVTSPASGGMGIQCICTGWTGTGSAPDSGSGTATSFAISEASSVTWNWTMQYQLTVTSPYGSPTGAGWYNSGATASSSVSSPVSGGTGIQYVCTGWTGTGDAPASGTTTNTGTFTMTQASGVTWNWKTQYYLTTAAGTGGTVAPSSGWQDAGKIVTVTATANSGYSFSTWSGDLSGSTNPTTITMTGPKSVTASFVTAVNKTLTVTNPSGWGTPTPAVGGPYSYTHGTNVTCTMDPAYYNLPLVGIGTWTDGFESGNLNDGVVAWSTGGTANWAASSSDMHSGSWCAKSGPITHSQLTWIEKTFNIAAGGGTLTFWWNVDSEKNYDLLEFYLDPTTYDPKVWADPYYAPGPFTARISGLGSGSSGGANNGLPYGWEQKTYNLLEGAHRVVWRYIKDPSWTELADCAWLDDVTITNTSTDASLSNLDFETGTLSQYRTGGVPLNKPWTAVTTLPQAGTYCAQSCNTLPDGASSYMERDFLVATGGATLTFYWKVSSESGSYPDYLNFYIDGVKQTGICGEVAWTQQTYTLTARTDIPYTQHTLRWEFARDTYTNASIGSNCGWVDSIAITSGTVKPPDPGMRRGCLGYTGTGSCPSGSGNTVTFPITATSTIQWNWGIQYSLVVAVNDSAMGTVTPSGTTWQTSGAVVTLTATPVSGGTFVNWTGDVTGTSNPTTVTMNAAKTVTANFSVPGKNIYVDGANGSDANNGFSWANAVKTIQQGLNLAGTSGWTVTVANGTYTGTGNVDLDFNGKNIVLQSANGKANCTIDVQGSASNVHRAFYFHNAETSSASVGGFTIKNGYTAGYGNMGGGIYCTLGASPTITDCIIDSCRAGGDGGGIACDNSASPTITNCVISNCFAQYACGGVDAESGGSFTMTNCTVVNCSAWNSGVGLNISDAGGTTTVTNSIIKNNTMLGGFSDYGAGVRTYNATANFVNCEITGNKLTASHAADGSGICAQAGSNLTMTNCLIANNDAVDREGGGVLGFYSGTIVLNNCTIANNNASYAGGGVCVGDWGSGTFPNITMNNCIIYGNTLNGSTACDVQIAGGTTVMNYCDYGNIYSGSPTLNNCLAAGTNPLFVDATNRNYRLQGTTPVSPCINAGSNALVPTGITTDLDDAPRTYNTTVDMGAYEYNPGFPRWNVVSTSAAGSPIPPAGTTIYGNNKSVVVMCGTTPYSGGAGIQYVCTGWTGGSGDIPATGTTTFYTFTITQNSTITWNWVTQYQLTTAVNNSSYGSVTPAAGTYWYNAGTIVQLTATANTGSGYAFINWTGSITGTTNPTTITMDGVKSVTANFAKPNFVVYNPTGYGSPNPAVGNYSYNYGASVTCTMTPDTLTTVPKTVGTGTSMQKWPIDISTAYGRTQMIYLASELGSAATINQIRFQRANASGTTNTINGVKIYMAHTAATTLTTDTWVPAEGESYHGFETDMGGWSSSYWARNSSYKKAGSYGAYYSAPVQSTAGTYDVTKTFTIGAGGGTLVYWRYVNKGSSTSSYFRCIDSVSGTLESVTATATTWTRREFSLAAGTHTLTFRIYRYGSTSSSYNIAAGVDCVTVTNAGGTPATLVFSGNITVPSGAVGTWYEIPLSTPFNYDGTSNLIVTFRHEDGSADASYTQWYTTNVTQRCLYCADGSGNWPPAAATTYVPNLQFDFNTGANMRYGCIGYTGTGSCPSGTGTSVQFYLTQDSTITWNWVAQYQLTMAVSPGGAGTTTPAVGTTWQGGDVSLTATPTDPTVPFSYWSGDLTGYENPKTLTMNGTKNVTANFGNPNLIMVNPGGYGSPTVTPSPPYSYNQSVTCSITSPVAGPTNTRYVCTGWTGTGSAPASGTGTTVTFNIQQNSWVTWQWKTQYYLTMAVSPSGAGTVTPGSSWQDANAVVTISASSTTSTFQSWSGSVTGSTNPTTVTMTGASISVTANFSGPQFTVSNPGSYDSPSPAAGTTTRTYNEGMSCSVTSPVAATGDTLEISSATSSQQAGPIDCFYDYARSQVIYLASEIGKSGTITKVRFKVTYQDTGNIAPGILRHCEMWMTHTALIAHPGTNTWVDPGTQVLTDSSINISVAACPVGSWLEITLTTPFAYNGTDNLLISFRQQDDGGGDWWRTYWACDTSKTGRVYGWYSDTTNPPPLGGANDFFSAALPWVQLEFGMSPGQKQYTCVSYTGTGDCPSGNWTGTPVTFNIKNNSSITWNWVTQYKLTTAVSGSGSVTPSGATWQTAGSAVTVTAIPTSGNAFSSWSGDLTGSVNPTTISMNSAKSVTAAFGAQAWTVTVTSARGNPYPPVGTTGFTNNASVTVSCGTTPISGGTGIRYVCGDWSGGSGNIPVNGTGTSYSFTITANSTITWNWKTQYYLTVNSPYSSPTGAGWYESGAMAASSVVSPVAGIPGVQYACTGWTGTGSAPASGTTNNTGPFSVNAVSSVTWNWKAQYQLICGVNNVNWGSVSPPSGFYYDAGAVASVTATANTGYIFSYWTGDLTGSANPAAIIMSGPKSVTANFAVSRKLTVASLRGYPSPNRGDTYFVDGGAVSANCGTTPVSGSAGVQYLCTGWSGTGSVPVSGTETSVNFTITTDSTITWTWKTQYYLTTLVSPPEGGTVTPSSNWYDQNAVVSCNATENIGYEWIGWGGHLSGTDKPKNLTMIGPRMVTANFIADPPIAGFTATPTSGTAPLTVQFTDTSLGANVAWAWDFENNGTVDSVEQNPVYTYTNPGTYTVKLTVWDDLGEYDTITKVGYITVSAAGAITADFSAAPTSGTAPLTVQFTDTSTNSPTAWAWDFENDGTVDSTIQNPSHTYDNTGWFTVKLTVTGDSDSDTCVKEKYIAVANAIWYVSDATGNDTNGGTSWADAFKTIDKGMFTAASGDVVLVADGLYKGAGNTNLYFRGKAIYVRSANGPANCIVEGGAFPDNSGFFFDAGETSSSVVDGFTVRNMQGNYGCGAFTCFNSSSPTITRCIITNNYVSCLGAGICSTTGCGPTITECTITNNIAGAGGAGIASWTFSSNSTVTIRDCVISINSAQNGAGIWCSESALTVIIDGSMITGNTATATGGGISCNGANLAMTNCIVTGNTAATQSGGGIWLATAIATMTNCVVAGNTSNAGGGIYCSNSSPTVNNCTIANNTANIGGGIYFDTGTATLNNTIIWGNGVANGQQIYLAQGNVALNSCNFANNASDIVNAGTGMVTPDGNCKTSDPLFVSPDGGNYRLQNTSLCIDAGDNVTVGNDYDLDGNPRLVDGNNDSVVVVDMGAYEFQSGGNKAPVVVILTAPSGTTTDDTPTFTFSGTGTTAKYWVSIDANPPAIDNGTNTSWTSPSLSIGSHTFYVQVEDSAGTKSAVKSQSFIYDPTPSVPGEGAK